MHNDDVNKCIQFLWELDQAWPYKRVEASSNMISRYNQSVGKSKGVKITHFAFNVDRNATVTDDMIWEVMTTDFSNYVEKTSFDDPNRGAPHTGKPKRTILDR